MNERLEATVRGVVQGVGFRWFIISEARRIGVHGWTANAPDGTVRVVAEGPPASLEKLLRVLHEGPRGAAVEAVEARRLAAMNEFESFTIRPGAHPGD